MRTIFLLSNIMFTLLISVVGIYIGILYSDLISFFPWGDNNHYFIWGLLVYYWLLPASLILLIISLLVNISQKDYRVPLLFLLLALGLYIPFDIGIDNASNLTGRWVGLVSSLFIGISSLGLTIFYIREIWKKRFKKT